MDSPVRTDADEQLDRAARPVLSFEEWAARVNAAPAPTPDDVTVLKDGRRLDTPEKVIAWVYEQAAERASEQAAGDGRS